MIQKQIHIFNKLMASALILFSLQVHAMEVEYQEPEPKSIDEILEYCVGLVKRLLEQPTRNGKLLFADTSLKYKYLCLRDQSDEEIFEYLNECVEGFASFNKLSRDGVSFSGNGIQFQWSTKECPLDQKQLDVLRKLYKKRIRSLQLGWRQEVLNINLRDQYGDISPQDCLLFSKKQSFEQEGLLIDSLELIRKLIKK